jgi:DNA-binding LacI/PurR family transcriptional regulator
LDWADVAERDSIKIQDVARHAGVSISTVSNALNGRPEQMRSDTLARVETAIAELGYRPNHAARQLKTGHTPIIGLLVPSIANPAFGRLAREVEIIAQERYGYRLLLGNTYRSLEKEASFVEDLLAHGVRGVIIVSPLANRDYFESASARGLVVVSHDEAAPRGQSPQVDYVSMDNAKAASLATQHLIDHGHTRLVFASASGRTVSRAEKIDGFLATARAAGLAHSARVLERKAQSGFGDSELAELGRAIAGEIVGSKARPTAIVALNDMLAIGIVTGLRDAGIRVPAEISVIGIDDLFLSSHTKPAISSIRPPVTEMAALMVERIMTRLADPSTPAAEFLFQPTLVARQTVASHRKPSHSARRAK